MCGFHRPLGGAVPCGLLVCVSRGWRCAIRIAGVRVAWVALCHGDYWCACRVGGAVPCGLLVCVSHGWRCAMGISGVRVAWAALCHGDCWWACRVGGAVSWGLLTEPLSGWRRVFGIADQGLVAVLVRVAAGVLASQNGSFLKAAFVQNRHFWRLVRVRAVACPKG